MPQRWTHVTEVDPCHGGGPMSRRWTHVSEVGYGRPMSGRHTALPTMIDRMGVVVCGLLFIYLYNITYKSI